MSRRIKLSFPLRVISILIISLLLAPIFISLAEPWHEPWNEPLGLAESGSEEYVIDGDVVYINDANAYIAVYPHTINTSQYIYVNVTSKTFSGKIDFCVGYPGDISRPSSIERYNPHNEITEHSEDLSYYFNDTEKYLVNYTYESFSDGFAYDGHIWVYENTTIEENEIIVGWRWQEIYSQQFDRADWEQKIIYWETIELVLWSLVADKLNIRKVSYSYNGMSEWYLANAIIQEDVMYHLRIFINIYPRLGKLPLTKYFFAFKPSSQTLHEAVTAGTLYILDPWLAGGWDKRVKITIDQNDIDTALSEFPVLIYLSSSSGRGPDDVTFVFDEIGANSKKIAITEADGETECKVEIEKWDNGSEEAWLWVKVPSIASGADTDLYLYYDNDHADNDANVGDTNSAPAEAVWDSNFKAVYHMRDGVDNEHIYDSTDYDKDGTKAGAGTPVETADGKIDGAQDFDGTTDYINIGTSALDAIRTIEVWFAPSITIDADAADVYCLVKRNTGDQAGEVGLVTIINTWPNPGHLTFYVDDANIISDSDTWTADVWYYVAGVAHSADGLMMYVDAVKQADTDADTDATNTEPDITAIGAWGDPYGRKWPGIIDEVRISISARGAEWIKASYESGQDDLVDFGTEEEYGPDDTYTWTFLSTTTTTSGTTTSTATDTDTTTTTTDSCETSTDLTTSTAGGGSPVIEDITPTTYAGETTHDINYPAVVDPDDLLIVVFTCDDDEPIAIEGEGVSWFIIYEEDAGAQGPTLVAAWREAVGDEDGGTFWITTGGAEGSCAYVFRITGAEDPDTQAPEASLEGTGSSVNPNSLSLDPTGGSKNFLWISAEGNDDDDDTTGYPANMADNNQYLQVASVTLGIATEEVSTDVFDPDQFTIAASETWEAVTIAVHPVDVATTITELTTTTTTSCETVLSTEWSSSSATTTVVYIWTVIQVIIDPITTVTVTSQTGTTTTCDATTTTIETTTTSCDTSVDSSTSSTTTCDTTVDSSTSSTTTCDTSVDSSTSSTTTCDTSVDSSTSSTTTCDTSVDSSTSSTTTCDTSVETDKTTTTTCMTSILTSVTTMTTCTTSVLTSVICETTCLTSEITETECETITVTHTTETQTTCTTSVSTSETTTTTCDTSVFSSTSSTTTCDTSVDSSTSSTTTCATETATSTYSSTSSTTTCDTSVDSSTSSTTTCDTSTDSSTYSSTSSTTTCDTSVDSSTSSTTICDTSIRSSTSSTTTCDTSVSTSETTTTICETSIFTSESTSCVTLTITHTTECETSCETSTSTSVTSTSTTSCTTSTSTSETCTTTCDTSVISSTSSTTTCDTSVDSSTSSTTTCDTSVSTSETTTTTCETSVESSTSTSCLTTTITHVTECSTTCETSTITSETVTSTTTCTTSTSTSETCTTTCDTEVISSTSSTTTCTSSTDSSVSSTTTCTSLTDTSVSSTTTCLTSSSISSTTSCETLTSVITTTTTTCDTKTEEIVETVCETSTVTHTTSTSTSCETITETTVTSTTTCTTTTSVGTSITTSVTTTCTSSCTSTSSCTTTTLETTITSGTQTTTTVVDTVEYDGCVLDEFDNDDLVALYDNTHRHATDSYVDIFHNLVDEHPDSILNITGIRDAGNLTSVLYVDTDYYNVSEVVGNPGFDIRFNFTGLTGSYANVNMSIYVWYDGGSGHDVLVQGWNDTGGVWVTAGTIPEGAGFGWVNITRIAGIADLITDGIIMGRIYHDDPGNVNHDIYIDYIEIRLDTSTCGWLWSTNMLVGLNVTQIVYFRYNITIPATATSQVQFSQDNATWVDSGGIAQWEDMTDGDHSIILTGLDWAGNFYYRIFMCKNVNGTSPELDLTQVCYSTTVGGEGSSTILNLVIILAVAIAGGAILIGRRR